MNKKNIKINNVPSILIFKENAQLAAKNGTIIMFHGLFSNKESLNKELENLAENGYLAIGCDNFGHGERLIDTFDPSKNIDAESDEFNMEFVNAVLKTVSEIPGIINGLSIMGLIQNGKLGITGISMGGFITYGAVKKDSRIIAAAPILGSPNLFGDEDSFDNFPEDFYPTALLSQVGGEDTTVSPEFARNFHNKLTNFYNEKPENLKYLEFPGENHTFSEKHWEVLWENVIHWFDKHIKHTENLPEINIYDDITQMYKEKLNY